MASREMGKKGFSPTALLMGMKMILLLSLIFGMQRDLQIG
ncbi:hypothetical protein EV14_1308 [Prochlorococcus sp. MIT 0703]|nr:hypothetical protein EV12_0502 [Prochlorococcus sp. MIT 0701]KGG34214.1 hypothetical protein EV14_1308 [Prochlorococcus sp. MIT 0703]